MNLNLPLPELLTLRKRLNAAIRAAKPKRAKVRKRKLVADPSYATFLKWEANCWACGRTRHDKPDFWHAPFMLERAHIVNKTRVEDCRAIVCLCSLCHRIAHGDTFTYCELPPLTKAHLLWLKQRHGGYDAAFLAKHSVGRLPEPERIPEEYTHSQVRFGARL